ncbi:hypothetical protein PsorP6_008365 [Peronosclerospora sorghi]|uniref:Uncharacterized protein n=1 Tax=Peronosclerospora sorghi TaxID=230839 RepID=A0ACC0W7P4_9STRA|nr:hypothetical protein PsorP6_008365 [Peronosclerospora sorghi]
MFVFEAVDDTGALALLQSVATKTQVPFEEYVVVAGRRQSNGQQLTCLGGRVKRDGKRRLLVVPVTDFHDTVTEASPRFQVLGVGELAVNFVQGVRACFPTLVRSNPMTELDSDSEETYKKDESYAKAQTEALTYMDQVRVKTLATLDELMSVYTIVDPPNVYMSLHNDPAVPKQCHLLCIECPPLTTKEDALPPLAVSSSTGLFNFGLMFLTSKATDAFLHIPVPRAPLRAASKDYEQERFQDATLLTFNVKREETVHGGGKTCEEMIQNIRMRHASGTFCTLVLPTKTWEQVANEHKSFFPQVCELQGKLRLRRLLGNAPCGLIVKLHLQS